MELGTEEEYKKYVLKISKNVDICTVVGFGRAGKDGTKVYKDNVCTVVVVYPSKLLASKTLQRRRRRFAL